MAKNQDFVKVGDRVIAKWNGDDVEGIVLVIASGKDKGKVRIKIDGDTAKYREIPIKSVMPVEWEIKPTTAVKPKTVFVDCLIEPEAVTVNEWEVKYNNLAAKIKDFYACCSGHTTKEEIAKLIKGI